MARAAIAAAAATPPTAAVVAGTAVEATAALQLRQGKVPAASAAPTRTPLLLSRRCPWRPGGLRFHCLAMSPSRTCRCLCKNSLTFLCTKKEQVGKVFTPLQPLYPNSFAW